MLYMFYLHAMVLFFLLASFKAILFAVLCFLIWNVGVWSYMRNFPICIYTCPELESSILLVLLALLKPSWVSGDRQRSRLLWLWPICWLMICGDTPLNTVPLVQNVPPMKNRTSLLSWLVIVHDTTMKQNCTLFSWLPGFFLNVLWWLFLAVINAFWFSEMLGFDFCSKKIKNHLFWIKYTNNENIFFKIL